MSFNTFPGVSAAAPKLSPIHAGQPPAGTEPTGGLIGDVDMVAKGPDDRVVWLHHASTNTWEQVAGKLDSAQAMPLSQLPEYQWTDRGGWELVHRDAGSAKPGPAERNQRQQPQKPAEGTNAANAASVPKARVASARKQEVTELHMRSIQNMKAGALQAWTDYFERGPDDPEAPLLESAKRATKELNSVEGTVGVPGTSEQHMRWMAGMKRAVEQASSEYYEAWKAGGDASTSRLLESAKRATQELNRAERADGVAQTRFDPFQPLRTLALGQWDRYVRYLAEADRYRVEANKGGPEAALCAKEAAHYANVAEGFLEAAQRSTNKLHRGEKEAGLPESKILSQIASPEGVVQREE